MSGAAVTAGALRQQIHNLWTSLQDTRSNLFVCDTLVRQIVKPAPDVSTATPRPTREAWMQTDARPVSSVGAQCARSAVESETCQTGPELRAQGTQTEDFADAVRNAWCQAVADSATSAVQTAEAGDLNEMDSNIEAE